MIIACRLLLGIGEGAALAVALTAAYEWFAADKRNIPSAIILQGISAGFLIGGPLLSHLVVGFGWRSSFLFCGFASLIWTLGYAFIGKQGPISAPARTAAEAGTAIPARLLWLDPTVIGVTLVAFFAYWVVGMSAVWLPPYLRVGLGYPALTAGWIISLIFIIQSPILLIGGLITQNLHRRGWNARTTLGLSAGVALTISGFAMLAAVTSPTGKMQIALLAIAFSVPSLTTIFGPVILAMIAPPAQRNRLVVVIFSWTSISAFFSTYGNGWIISLFPGDPHTGYARAFAIGGAALLAGAVAAFTLLSPEKSQARFAAYRAAKAN